MLKPGQRQPMFPVESASERLFRVDRVEVDGSRVSTSMPVGGWLHGSGSAPAAGALGVLVDTVLGYAITIDRPTDYWSVSTEISLDVCTAIPADATRLSGTGDLVASDVRGGVSSGTVVDEAGRLIAVCRQHGRYIAQMPSTPLRPWQVSPVDRPAPAAADLFELLDARLKLTSEGAELELTAIPDLVNPLGNLHGGVALCAADLVGNAAAQDVGRPFRTASIHVAYIRPVPAGATVTYVASVAHSGRTFAVVRITGRGENGKACTIATVTAIDDVLAGR